MESIEDISTDLIQVKNEQCIVLRTRDSGKVVLTNPDEIGLKEWLVSLRTALKCSHEMLSRLKKAGKIYGTTEVVAAATAAGGGQPPGSGGGAANSGN